MLGLRCASDTVRLLVTVSLLMLSGPLAAQPLSSESISPAWPDSPRQLPTPHPLDDDVRRAAGQAIVEVRIVGNETVSEDEVIKLMRTRRNRQFDPEIVQKDKRNLISSGLFREVRISWQQAVGGVIVTFEVLERPTIRYLRFHGDRRLGAKNLRRESGLEVGEALNTYSVQEARRRVEDLYHRSGFPKAEVAVLEGDRPGDRGVVFAISEGPLVRLWHVGFVGNQLVTAERLRAVLREKFFDYRRGLKANVADIDKDQKRLTAYYRSFGYFQATISRVFKYNESQGWLTVTFVINEGPQYAIRNVEVVGNEQFATTDLKTLLELNNGDYFNQGKMNRDLGSIKEVYHGQGYVYADITAQPRFLMDEPALDMVYKINEGDQFVVGRINVRIAGEYPHTRESVVLNRISVRPGDIVDMNEVRASERRLKASQLFENNPAEGKTPSIRIRDPALADAEEMIGRQGGPTVRGQTPHGWWPKYLFRRPGRLGDRIPATRAPYQGSGRR